MKWDFFGVYSDPNHLECPRDIMFLGTNAVIMGVDGNTGCLLSTVKILWTVDGMVSDNDIIVDIWKMNKDNDQTTVIHSSFGVDFLYNNQIYIYHPLDGFLN